MLNNILNEMKKANAIVILTHQFPDGDAISSSIALKMLLGDKADIVIPSFPESFTFLPGSDVIKKASDKKYDLAIALDCANLIRLMGHEEYFKKAKRTIAIDHHVTNENFAKYNFVDASSPSCTQILAEIFRDREPISKDVATCLLAGIVSDTSAFIERNVTAKTFEIVSFLTSRGADYQYVYENLMQHCTKDQFRLKQLIVSRVVINKKVAMSYLTKEDVFSGTAIDHKYLLSEYQYIDGVEVVVLFIEYENAVKVSLRSRNTDILNICKKFDGGGHKTSAGCVIPGTLENAKAKILKELG
ncbi:MAG: bifunctional oligoribonuclease/PAP phosphatase NrnA [Clostridia bacterium]|nr:bifunctional oligoribonuclease/PAP phosphatase NrnA [Clostridia bacterium]